MNKAKLIVFLSIFTLSLASYLSFFAYKQTNTYKAKADCEEWGVCDAPMNQPIIPPKPGDEDFIGPVNQPPKPGDPDFIGPVDDIPKPGDPDFIGPVDDIPKPGDPDFIGPVNQKPPEDKPNFEKECMGPACDRADSENQTPGKTTTTTTTNTRPNTTVQNTTISKGALFTQGSITVTIAGHPELVLNTCLACPAINPPANCFAGTVNQNSTTFTFTPQNTNPVPLGVCCNVAQAYQQQVGAQIECLQFVN